MAKCKLLAFLLCESASLAPEPDNRVTLTHLFDKIKLPQTPGDDHVPFIWAYYKVDVGAAPCNVVLRIVGPQEREIPGNRRHPIDRVGPIQGVWALDVSLFKEPGTYDFELKEESDGSEPRSLARTRLVVDAEGK